MLSPLAEGRELKFIRSDLTETEMQVAPRGGA